VHRFTLRPSAILAAILLVAHTAAVAVLFLLNLPTWTLVAGAAVLICNLLYVLDAVLLRRHDALVAIEITSERGINAQSRSGKWSEYEVLNDTFVSAFLRVLRLKDVDYALRLADSLGVATPFGDAARQAFARLVALGARDDHEARVIEVARQPKDE